MSDNEQEQFENDVVLMPEPEASECPMCGGPTFLLGQLGYLVWLRCRNCGMDCSVQVPA